ncbi:MAG TPA: two-component regulator propeller domain-containing protein, partial [Chitinophagales bacterium]|nr:two-component regulator propeller domain-containing protein [Chitinophagales bacterium]
MNFFPKIYAFVILITLWGTTLFSALGLDISQMNFRVLDIKDGISQNTVTSIFQDSKGFIWFCTDEGVNRYDGYNFMKFD